MGNPITEQLALLEMLESLGCMNNLKDHEKAQVRHQIRVLAKACYDNAIDVASKAIRECKTQI